MSVVAMTRPLLLTPIEANAAPPLPSAVRGLSALLAESGFGAAQSVSPEPRGWHSWPREILRSATLGPAPEVLTGSVWARRQLQQLEQRTPAGALLFRLLTIGEPVPSARMNGHVPAALRERLRIAGIARESDGMWRAEFRVLPLQGLFVLADFPRSRDVLGNAFVQLGLDSGMLARMIEQEAPGGMRALDLCTGGGIQALVLSRKYAHVDGTDINERAIAMAAANAALNGVEGSLKLSVADLFGDAGGRYDMIVANPPFMFLPEDVAKTNLTGDGGALGIHVTLRILAGLSSRLTDDGRAFVYTQAPRLDGRCTLVEQTRSRLAGETLHLEFEEILRGYWSPFRDFYRRMHVEWITCYRIRARRASAFGVTVRPLTGWRRSAMALAVAVERRGWR